MPVAVWFPACFSMSFCPQAVPLPSKNVASDQTMRSALKRLFNNGKQAQEQTEPANPYQTPTGGFNSPAASFQTAVPGHVTHNHFHVTENVQQSSGRRIVNTQNCAKRRKLNPTNEFLAFMQEQLTCQYKPLHQPPPPPPPPQLTLETIMQMLQSQR